MSILAGIVRWADGGEPDQRDAERLKAAVASTAGGRPVLLSQPPAHVAFCQSHVTPEDRWERQPGVAGPVLSLFDGRIDDRDGLAERLGHPLDGVPDGALALAAFRRWGADAAARMLGEFAWAVWDGAGRRLVLARDTSISRTLYVCRTDRFVAFASTLNALFALPDVPREVDEDALADFLVLNPDAGERTLYRNVFRLLPGTTMIIDRDGLRREENWVPNRATASAPRSPGACAEAAREVFGRAVQARLRSIGPVAVSLSGGLDSSAIAAEAARRLAPTPVFGFLMAPPEGVPLAARPWMAPHGRVQVAALGRAYPNLRVGIIEPPNDPIETDPTALFLTTGLPVRFSPVLGWFLPGWRAARAAGARVIMTGDEGEASLTHHGSLPAMVREGSGWHVLREAWRVSRRQGYGFLGMLDAAFLGGRVSALRPERRRRLTWPGDWRRFSPIHPDLAERAGVRARLLAADFPAGSSHAQLGYAALLARAQHCSGPAMDNIAALRQLSGLDHTDPFADRRVLEFCLSLPEEMFVRDGWPRWLARTAFRDLLPPEIRDDPRKGEQNPEWFHRLTGRRDAIAAELERIASSPLACRSLDIPRLKALLDRWPASAEDAEAMGPAYRSILVRGLHVGGFLRWIDPGNGG